MHARQRLHDATLRRGCDTGSPGRQCRASVGEDADKHTEEAERILADFEANDIVHRLDTPDADGRLYDVTNAAPLAASFDRPLVPFVRAAIEALEPDDPTYDLDVLSIVESILDDPRTIIRAQVRAARDAKYHEMKEPGQSLEERNAML